MTRTCSGMPALPSCLHPGGELRHPDEDLRSSARSGLDHQAIVVAEGVTQPHVYVAQADRVELRVPGQGTTYPLGILPGAVVLHGDQALGARITRDDRDLAVALVGEPVASGVLDQRLRSDAHTYEPQSLMRTSL